MYHIWLGSKESLVNQALGANQAKMEKMDELERLVSLGNLDTTASRVKKEIEDFPDILMGSPAPEEILVSPGYREREDSLVSKATLVPQADISKAPLGRKASLERWDPKESLDWMASPSGAPLDRTDWKGLLDPLDLWVMSRVTVWKRVLQDLLDQLG